MRYSFAAFIAVLGFEPTYAKFDVTQVSGELSHEHADHIGTMHTEAFEKMSELYSIERPANKDAMMEDVAAIIESYCPAGDDQCKASAKDYVDTDPYGEIDFPDDFDSELLQSIDDIYATVQLVDEHNLDEVLEKLDTIKNEVVEMNHVNFRYKMAVLAGLSVTGESTRYWHKVYSDEDHPLHRLHQPSYYPEEDESTRRLQFDPIAPSVTPSSQPNGKPSRAPSVQPSNTPNKQPSGAPIEVKCKLPTRPPNTGSSKSSKSKDGEWFFEDFEVGAISIADGFGAIKGVIISLTTAPEILLNPVEVIASAFAGSFSASAAWAISPPSSKPSQYPSNKPSVKPSCAPSSQPSSQPSISPSFSPSLRPSSSPNSPSLRLSSSPN